MAIKLTTTNECSNTIKCLVYGKSGIGKTTLISTLPNPIIVSSEHKLLALKDKKIPVILIETLQDFEDAFSFIRDKGQKFKSIALDSVSDIAETILADFKENPPDGNNDPRAAYGLLNDKVLPLIKKFKTFDKHIYVIAKEQRVTDDFSGITTWSPAMPGRQLGPNLPYLFDYVFAMRAGETDKGRQYRYLQTVSDIQYEAKGTKELNPIEKPDLGLVIMKILGGDKEIKKESKNKNK